MTCARLGLADRVMWRPREVRLNTNVALPAVLRAPLPPFPLPFLRKAYLAGACGIYSLRDALG